VIEIGNKAGFVSMVDDEDDDDDDEGGRWGGVEEAVRSTGGPTITADVEDEDVEDEDEGSIAVSMLVSVLRVFVEHDCGNGLIAEVAVDEDDGVDNADPDIEADVEGPDVDEDNAAVTAECSCCRAIAGELVR
jgi:hypothetical protein